jgi:HK97 family phage major capsid protein
MNAMHPEQKVAEVARLAQELEKTITHYKEQKSADSKETKQAVERLQGRLDEMEAQGQKAGLAPRSASAVEGKGPLLPLEAKAAPVFAEAESDQSDDFDVKNVRLGALLMGVLHYGEVKSQLTPDERKALSVIVDPSGGMLIPQSIGRMFIDAVRPRTQILAAGGMTYAMTEGPNVSLPGWDTPPQAGWRGATGQFPDAGGSFRNVQLNAKDLGCYLDIPGSLFDDAASNLGAVDQLIQAQLAKAIAQAIDLAALLSKDVTNAGGGTQVPMGLAALDSLGVVSANYGIPLATSSGTNGGTPSYDWYIDAAAAVAGQNFKATGHISAPRTFASLGKAKDSQLRYLDKPQYLADLRDYETNQVPITLKKGTNTDTAASFVGDFSQMVVGMRNELSILRDPYTGALGRTIRLVVWQRADVAVLNKNAFQIVDGVRP